MIILITGTPGVGKTTVSSILAERLDAHLININELVNEKCLYTGIDEEREYKIVDLDALFNEMDNIIKKVDGPDEYVIIEGHLSHLFEKSDIVIVLRANPDVLQDRMKIKGWKKAKIRENVEAEAIDVCSYEAFEIHSDKVNELNTSDIPPEKVVDLIIDVINGDKRFPVGSMDFLEYLEKF
jgi:adenylate kinase